MTTKTKSKPSNSPADRRQEETDKIVAYVRARGTIVTYLRDLATLIDRSVNYTRNLVEAEPRLNVDRPRGAKALIGYLTVRYAGAKPRKKR